MRKILWRLVLVGLLSSLALSSAWAQKYPSRALTLVCPFAPGGSADIMARLVAQKLGESLGVPVVVENRPGAGSAVGSNLVAKAKPDGYTLLLITGAYPAQAALTKAPLFDPVRDIAMVSMVSSYPFIVNVNPASPFRSFAELLAYARANPGKLNYASSGIGSIGHLSSELLNVMAGTEIVHIPTKGGNVALTELLAGRIDFLLEAPTLSLPYIQSGKLRALAATGKERSKTLADLPTVAESLPGYEVISFIGLGVTNGTPEPIVAQLSAEMKKIIDQPDTAKRLQDLGGEPQASTPEEMKRFVEQEFRKWRKVVDVRKIEAL
jgi:tripartite-type tricarboxylate transporter receptor subunit TctC